YRNIENVTEAASPVRSSGMPSADPRRLAVRCSQSAEEVFDVARLRLEVEQIFAVVLETKPVLLRSIPPPPRRTRGGHGNGPQGGAQGRRGSEVERPQPLPAVPELQRIPVR